MLTLGGNFLPGLCDSGSSTSFLRRDVLANVKKIGITYSVVSEQDTCLMVDGQACEKENQSHCLLKFARSLGNLIFFL
jgi:hypothetical protein